MGADVGVGSGEVVEVLGGESVEEHLDEVLVVEGILEGHVGSLVVEAYGPGDVGRTVHGVLFEKKICD